MAVVGLSFLTDIFRQRRSQSVFLSPEKEKLKKERPLRGLRREVRFIMSPPGKRRHNELNAAPPPENPQGTGATDGGSDGDGVHSGKCFGIRAETHQSAIRAARFHRAVLGFPFEGCEAGARQ